jgi:hypothetical protein
LFTNTTSLLHEGLVKNSCDEGEGKEGAAGLNRSHRGQTIKLQGRKISGITGKLSAVALKVQEIGSVWLYSYAVLSVAHADHLSSYRKRKALWGMKASPSAVLLSIC